MEEKRLVSLRFLTKELRESADWKEAFSRQQQDKARFFITLISTLMFVVGMSLNNIPPQKYLLMPCAASFLICFGFAFWSMYYFAKVIEPRFFHGRNEQEAADGTEGEEYLLQLVEKQGKRQNAHLDAIIDLQAKFLNLGVWTFIIFNVVFAVALVVSRLSWFLPGN